MTLLHNIAVVKCVSECSKIILDAELAVDVKIHLPVLLAEYVVDVQIQFLNSKLNWLRT
jgi:hypothetical protein